MAAVSAPYSSKSQADQRWDYAVSPTDENTPPSDLKISQTNSGRDANESFAQPETNGEPLRSSSSNNLQAHRIPPDTYGGVRSNHALRQELLPPNRLGLLDRKHSEGSEADSLLDLYGRDSVDRSRLNSMDHGGRKVTNGAIPDTNDTDNSSWIHRDKLAKIESEELHRAGIFLPKDHRTGSRRKVKKERSREHLSDEFNVTDVVEPEEKRQRVASPVPIDADEDDTHHMPFDLRMPEEAAADPYEERCDKPLTPVRPSSRKSNQSRIPLPRSSPLPIRQDFIDMETPTPRKGSGTWNGMEEASIVYPKSRGRSQSGGSQAQYDDSEGYGNSTAASGLKATPPGSPKSKTPTKTPTGTHSRKSSATREFSGQNKTPLRSRDSPGPRPSTRSGEPTPVKRPEGDPPWLATMYKPDPRLPPDQQLLPTVAKRLQQEQWEREGKSGSTFDREFNPVEVHEDRPVAKPQAAEITEEKKEQQGDWPLAAALTPTSNGPPVNGGSDHGGYKVIPNIQNPRESPTQGASAQPSQTLRVKDPPQEKKEGGCSCCIVM
ncbi:MAG: hypothetical protein M1833_000545 [Piccolia ochrophora]|nr:MAG: hypothetical protein M1833_000545 [Piccolia ochrophora]